LSILLTHIECFTFNSEATLSEHWLDASAQKSRRNPSATFRDMQPDVDNPWYSSPRIRIVPDYDPTYYTEYSAQNLIVLSTHRISS